MTPREILDLLGDERRYTLHSHTQFCDGKADMAQFAAEAVRRGFTHYGFSPHSPIPIASPCNMSMDDVPVFLAEVSRLNKLFAHTPTRFYSSMEIDYLSPEWSAAIPYFRNLPLDYRISSVHFIPTQKGVYVDIDGHEDAFLKKVDNCFEGDIRYIVDTFFAQSHAMIDCGGFEIIGHFDKIGRNASAHTPGIEDEDFYVKHISDLIDHIKDAGLIAELNTKAVDLAKVQNLNVNRSGNIAISESSVRNMRTFPSPRFLSMALERGVPFIINSDAHQPHLIDHGRPEAFALIDTLTSKFLN